jgi:SOS response regulatory protein OraA/RecX
MARLRAKEKSDPEIVQNLLRKGFSYGQIKEEMKKEDT